MYDPKVMEKLGITKFRKNGGLFSKDVQKVRDWEKAHYRSSYLTSCHENGCGKSVIFEKIEGFYRYRCAKCGHWEEVSISQGMTILGF